MILRLGFVLKSSKGSHRTYSTPDGKRVTLPFHPGDIPTGTLRAIIAQAGLSVAEFNRLV